MSPAGQLRTTLVQSTREIAGLRDFWNGVVLYNSSEINQLDLTNTYEWATCLWRSHLPGQQPMALLIHRYDELVGLIPLRRFRRSIRSVSCRTFEPVSQLYSGRTGFLFKSPDTDFLVAALDGITERLGAWDTFGFTVVQGSTHESLLLEAAQKRNWRTLVLERASSPYIPFHENWELHRSLLPKKLRSTMRSGEKRLTERGNLSYKEFLLPSDVSDFCAAVKMIEDSSWKASSGTSIASNPVHEAFHSAFASKAAAQGWFSGHLLSLNDAPIAYIMGLLHQGVFLDLKESYSATYRDMSPGHVLKSFAFQRLYQRGTRYYDFMGTCEEYKMKWTDKTYTRATYLLFNNTFRGKLARVLGGSWRAENPYSNLSGTRVST